MRAERVFPRTSISIAVPGCARSAETYAIPIPRSSDGENVPLVTTPPPITGFPARAIPSPSMTNGTSFCAGGFARAAAMASDPMKPVSS
jgi:hypothetical protein